MQPNTRSPDCEQIRRGTQVACRNPAEAEHCFSLRGADFSSLSPQRSSEVCCGAAAQRPVCARESHHSRAHVFFWRALRFAPAAGTRVLSATHRERHKVHAVLEASLRARRHVSTWRSSQRPLPRSASNSARSGAHAQTKSARVRSLDDAPIWRNPLAALADAHRRHGVVICPDPHRSRSAHSTRMTVERNPRPVSVREKSIHELARTLLYLTCREAIPWR